MNSTTINKSIQSYNALGTVTKFFTVIVGVLFLFLLGYVIYYYYNVSRYGSRASPIFIDKPVNAFDDNLSRETRQLPVGSEGLSFTYNFWIYVADWQYKFSEKKTIFVKGKVANRAPEVYLTPTQNSLAVALATFAEPSGEVCIIDNIPLQKWINISVVLDNRTLDIYLDGKLERSFVLKGVPKMNRNALQFAPDGGFYGQISMFRYFNRPITPDEASSIYSQGPY